MLRIAAVVLLAPALSGCKDVNWLKVPAPEPRSGSSLPPPESSDSLVVATRPFYVPTPLEAAQAAVEPDTAPRRPVVLQSIDFRILRIRAPAGTFSESGKIWNAVDEEVVPAQLQQLLRRNGFRVGLGSAENWPQMKAILDAEKVEVVDRRKAVYNSLPLIVDLERPPKDQTLFLFRQDGTMAGATFPKSTNVLRVEYGISTAEANTVIVDVMPEIRLMRVDTSPAFELNWPEPPPIDPPSRPLRELSVRLTIRPEQFLAVGPSAAARKGYLPGSLLLCDEVDGVRFEALYIITPRIVIAGGDSGSGKAK